MLCPLPAPPCLASITSLTLHLLPFSPPSLPQPQPAQGHPSPLHRTARDARRGTWAPQPRRRWAAVGYNFPAMCVVVSHAASALSRSLFIFSIPRGVTNIPYR